MCEWGDTVLVEVRVPPDLSHTLSETWKLAQIDRCIADVVVALQALPCGTRSSCCGHGKGDGEIILGDGRRLVVPCVSAQSAA